MQNEPTHPLQRLIQPYIDMLRARRDALVHKIPRFWRVIARHVWRLVKSIVLLAWYLLMQMLIQARRKHCKNIDRTAVIDAIRAEGRMTSRFTLMTILSCGVATMGLLQSSPAVVIGAMLMSPLMSPIMALGFGLCVMDVRLVRKSGEALFIGMILALAISFILVTLSPLNDVTPEIMARTSPNLLDLAIAVFSAVAGGYAAIRRKGEALVGVAIATALMPPLAVVGYGLATGSAAIASGSFFLFITNLFAIALTVTLVALWYGFGYRHGKHESMWQVVGVIVIFGILAVPLASSLEKIAYQVAATRTAKTIITSYFEQNKIPTRVEMFHTTFGEENDILIDTVILTRKYDAKAREGISQRLSKELDRQITLSLDQVVISGDTQAPDEALALNIPSGNVIGTTTAPVIAVAGQDTKPTPLARLREALNVPADIASEAEKPLTFTVRPKPVEGATLQTYVQMKHELSAKLTDLTITLVPPEMPLPPLHFAGAKETLDADELALLDDAIWALKRWGVKNVEVVGLRNAPLADGQEDTLSQALRRARYIARLLTEKGIQGAAVSQFDEAKATSDTVEIRLISDNAEEEKATTE